MKKKQIVKKKVLAKKKLDLSGDDPLEQDLTEFMDRTKYKWVRFSDLFEFQPKNKTITLRMPESMLECLKDIAEKENTDYQKLIRKALSEFLAKKTKKAA
ncbi:MAG: CopG family antitoxin [Bacteriovorax sp.]|nr:CopG family antitoxin [Bacteriovorax sp.]